MPERWRNWSGEQRCAPERIERPQSEEEVAEAVRRAVAEGRRVRVSASGHSFTDIACTDDVMLRLDALDEVVSVDGTLVEVEAGHHAAQARRRARRHAGSRWRTRATSTASSSPARSRPRRTAPAIGFPNLSAQVVALRLVTADGEVRELSEDRTPTRGGRPASGSARSA